MNPRTAFLAAAAGAVLLISGCGGPDELGPPVIRLGRDQCAECGMLIMEDRCSAARVLTAQRHDGAELFDDIGCLLDFEREKGSEHVVERYFRDHDTGAWIPSTSAVFLVAQGVRTPMASGMVAYSSPARAEQRSAETSGRVLGFAALAEARAAAVRERRQGSGG